MSEFEDKRPYFVLTNEYPDHRKIRHLSDKAFRLHITLLALCNKDKSDGGISDLDLNQFGKKVGEELVKRGLVEATSDPELFLMHDYLEHQRSADQIQELSEKRGTAGGKGGKLAMHNRWHVKRNLINEDCWHCINPDKQT